MEDVCPLLEAKVAEVKERVEDVDKLGVVRDGAVVAGTVAGGLVGGPLGALVGAGAGALAKADIDTTGDEALAARAAFLLDFWRSAGRAGC